MTHIQYVPGTLSVSASVCCHPSLKTPAKKEYLQCSFLLWWIFLRNCWQWNGLCTVFTGENMQRWIKLSWLKMLKSDFSLCCVQLCTFPSRSTGGELFCSLLIVMLLIFRSVRCCCTGVSFVQHDKRMVSFCGQAQPFRLVDWLLFYRNAVYFQRRCTICTEWWQRCAVWTEIIWTSWFYVVPNVADVFPGWMPCTQKWTSAGERVTCCQLQMVSTLFPVWRFGSFS